jgi:hypothetical protein
MTWIVVEFPGPGPFQTFAVAKVDDAGELVHTHPIYFPYQREADRAAARLNLRDSGELVISQLPTEDEVRAVRLARIAELRAKRQSA